MEPDESADVSINLKSQLSSEVIARWRAVRPSKAELSHVPASGDN